MFSDFSLDFEPSLTAQIDLPLDAVLRSRIFVEAISLPALRWQSYRALLAYEGFLQWLEDGNVPMTLDRRNVMLIQPTRLDGTAAIYHLEVNGFKCCIVCAEEGEVELPVSVVDNSAQASHFYIAIAVHEEQQQVTLQAFVRYNELRRHDLNMTSDRTYEIPVSVFETNFDQLLLYFTCLERSAIALPEISLMQSQERLYQWLVQPAVNVLDWLQQQVDAITENLVWTFSAPTLSPLRSNDPISAVSTELERSGIHVPDSAQAAYRTLTIGNYTFQLAVILWITQPDSEWSLLAILQAQAGDILPENTRLMIREQQTLIVESLTVSDARYLIVQAFGAPGEQLLVEIQLANGDQLTLPAFTLPHS